MCSLAAYAYDCGARLPPQRRRDSPRPIAGISSDCRGIGGSLYEVGCALSAPRTTPPRFAKRGAALSMNMAGMLSRETEASEGAALRAVSRNVVAALSGSLDGLGGPLN